MLSLLHSSLQNHSSFTLSLNFLSFSTCPIKSTSIMISRFLVPLAWPRQCPAKTNLSPSVYPIYLYTLITLTILTSRINLNAITRSFFLIISVAFILVTSSNIAQNPFLLLVFLLDNILYLFSLLPRAFALPQIHYVSCTFAIFTFYFRIIHFNCLLLLVIDSTFHVETFNILNVPPINFDVLHL